MFHKVLNVSLVFLTLSKINTGNLSTVNDKNQNYKAQTLQMLLSLSCLEYKTLPNWCFLDTSKKKQIALSFRRAPRISRLIECQARNLVKQCQIKTSKQDSERLILSKCYIQGAPQTKQHHLFFPAAQRDFRKNEL